MAAAHLSPPDIQYPVDPKNASLDLQDDVWPRTPSASFSTLSLGQRRIPACEDCRLRKRRCIHDEYGNLDPNIAGKTKPTSPVPDPTYTSPPPPDYQDSRATFSHVNHQKTVTAEPTSFSSAGQEEGFGHILKVLDPEDVRPDFAGRARFAKLAELSKARLSSSRDAKPKRSILKKGLVSDSVAGVAGTALQNVIDLSDDDFSSPKSRRHKLTAEQLSGLGELTASTAETSKLKTFIEKHIHNNQHSVKPEASDDCASKQAVNPGKVSQGQKRPGGDVSGPKDANHDPAGHQDRQGEDGKTKADPLQIQDRQSQSSYIPPMIAQQTTMNDKPKLSRTSFWPEDLKRPLAVAARKALQSNPWNSRRTIYEHTIQNLLDETGSYESFCKLLERQGFRVERIPFAQQLLASVPKMKDTACFSQSNPAAGNVNVQSMTAPDSHMDDIIGEPKVMQKSAQNSPKLPSPGSVLQTTGDEENRRMPRLIAPVANMGPRALSNNSGVIDNSTSSATPDQPCSANDGSASKGPMREHAVGTQPQIVQNTLSQMETLIQKQKEDALLKERARKVQERSQSTSFATSVFSTTNDTFKGDDDGVNISQYSFKRSTSPESSLFLPDFESPASTSRPRGSGQRHVRFDDWSGNNNGSKPNARKRRREIMSKGGLTITDMWDPQKRTDIAAKVRTRTTLKDGHFALHEEQRRALLEYDKRKRSCQREEAFDGQYIDLHAAANEYDQATNGRPTTGGKGISDATIRRWEAESGADAYLTPTDSEIDEDELGEPETFYRYSVQVREWLIDESEADARVTDHGPFYTMQEANAVAADSIQKPSEARTNTLFRSGAWSYNYSKDDEGLETHITSFCGRTIEASVSRSIAPANQRAKVPVDAFTIPRVVYVVMSQQISVPPPIPSANEDDLFGDPPNEPSTADIKLADTLKACTTLDLANKTAAQKWLDQETKDFEADEYSDLCRARLETTLRKDLRQLNDENGAFDRECCGESPDEKLHIWVEWVEIDGPRN